MDARNALLASIAIDAASFALLIGGRGHEVPTWIGGIGLCVGTALFVLTVLMHRWNEEAARLLEGPAAPVTELPSAADGDARTALLA